MDSERPNTQGMYSFYIYIDKHSFTYVRNNFQNRNLTLNYVTCPQYHNSMQILLYIPKFRNWIQVNDLKQISSNSSSK